MEADRECPGFPARHIERNRLHLIVAVCLRLHMNAQLVLAGRKVDTPRIVTLHFLEES